LWSFRFGDAASQKAYGVAADKDGNVIVAGTFEGSIDFGGGELKSAGATDIFVAKLGPSGEHIWSARFGDAEAQSSVELAVDAGGSAILAGALQGAIDFGGGALTSAVGTSNAFVAKLDSAGKHAWSRRLSDSGSVTASAVVTDDAGSIVVSGDFSGTVDFGDAPRTSEGVSSDLFLAKLSDDGNTLWSKQFGNSYGEFVTAMGIGANGRVFWAGKFDGTMDLGCGDLTSVGSLPNIFLAKFDADGGCFWSKRFGEQFKQMVKSLAVDFADNVVVTGTFTDTIDFGGDPLTSTQGANVFLAKLSAGGAHLFSKSFGDESIQHGDVVAVSSAGEVLVGGTFGGVIDFGGGSLTASSSSEAFLAKLDAGGDHLWSKQLGGVSLERVLVDEAGTTIFTGCLSETADFGGGPLVSAGGCDVAVAKLEP
jgi:hypothetical protein